MIVRESTYILKERNVVDMIMSTMCATLWSVLLILQFIDYRMGGTPGWLDVFCPLIVVVIIYWTEVLTKKE